MANLSKRYAEALYTKAQNKEKYQKYLEEFTSIYNDTVLKVSLKNPRIKKEEKIDILKEVTPKDKTFNNFINLLLDKNRLDLLEEITNNYKDMLDKQNKKITIKIITPYEITKKEAKDIADKFKKQENAKEVCYKLEIDETLIGGIKVILNGKVYDGSVKTKLKNLL